MKEDGGFLLPLFLKKIILLRKLCLDLSLQSLFVSGFSAYKEQPPLSPCEYHSTPQKNHSTPQKNHFTPQKNHFTPERKPGNPHYIRLFRVFQNPNILSIDNQLIIKTHSPPMPTAAAML